MNHEGTHPARDPAGQAWTRGAAQGQAGSHSGRSSLLLLCFGARLGSSLAPRACLHISGSGFTFLAERRKARKITPSKAPVLSSAPDLSAGRGKALPPPPPFPQRVQGHQGRTHPSGCGHPPDHQRRGAGDTVPLLPLSPGRSLRPRPGKGALPCRDRQVEGDRPALSRRGFPARPRFWKPLSLRASRHPCAGHGGHLVAGKPRGGAQPP